MLTEGSPAPVGAGAIQEAPFYIPATGPAARPRRTLKHGDSFIVVDAHGDIGASPGGPDGLFHADTRFLSRFEILVNGMQLLLLGSNLRDDNAVLKVDLTNPDIFFDKRLILEKDTLHIDRTIFLWRGTAFQRLALRNYGARAVNLALSVGFDSDFADLFEVRGARRARRGVAVRKVTAPDQVTFTYTGLDRVVRTTVIHFDPTPLRIAETSASYHLSLTPGETTVLYVATQCNPHGERPAHFLGSLHQARRDLRNAARDRAAVQTSNALFNEVLCRSIADLAMLITDTEQGPYPYAGIPWYSTTFGRDALITAIEMLWVDPRIARGVLRRLAALQATTRDPQSDAEPGKILHEMRAGEMAALGEVPFRLYYGSVDSTPLFVLLAGLYLDQTGDVATIAALWPSIEAALAWIDHYGDPDRDGFVEYARQTEQGLANQGWKDSVDSVFHADGRLAEGPIALAEVQAYVFHAKQLAARCVPRAHLQCRPGSVLRHCPARARAPGDACPDGSGFLLRLGHSHGVAARAALQSDVVSRRLDLAARQRADRARLCPLRCQVGDRSPVQGHVRDRHLYGFSPPARAVLRVPALAGPGADTLSGSLLAAGLVGGDAVLPVAGRARARARSGRAADPVAQSAAAVLHGRCHPAQPQGRWRQRRHRGPRPRQQRVAARPAQAGRRRGFDRLFGIVARRTIVAANPARSLFPLGCTDRGHRGQSWQPVRRHRGQSWQPVRRDRGQLSS